MLGKYKSQWLFNRGKKIHLFPVYQGFVVVVIIAIAGFGCSPRGWQVKSNYDRQQDYSQYRSFRFTDTALDIQLKEEDRTELLTAIKEHFELRNINYDRNADFLVNLLYQSEQEDDSRSRFNNNYPYSYGYNPYYYQNDFFVNYWTNGIIIMECLDATTREVFWSVEATNKVSSHKNEQPIKPSDAVSKMLADFPLNATP